MSGWAAKEACLAHGVYATSGPCDYESQRDVACPSRQAIAAVDEVTGKERKKQGAGD